MQPSDFKNVRSAEQDATFAAASTRSNRIGRVRYLTWLCSIYLIVQLCSISPALWIAAMIGGLGCYVWATVKRVRDLGLSGWFALLLGLPLVSLVLLVLPGTSSSNRHGAPPQPITRKENFVALGVLAATAAMFVLTWLVVIAPALARYRAATGI